MAFHTSNETKTSPVHEGNDHLGLLTGSACNVGQGPRCLELQAANITILSLDYCKLIIKGNVLFYLSGKPGVLCCGDTASLKASNKDGKNPGVDQSIYRRVSIAGQKFPGGLHCGQLGGGL